VCPSNTFKPVEEQDPAAPAQHPAPSTLAPGSAAEDHDSAEDCLPISCPAGLERDLQAGGCRVCASNFYKPSSRPAAMPALPSRDPFTSGSRPTDHDRISDCFALTCGPGQQLSSDTLRCTACPDNTYKTGQSTDSCTACPEGTITLGRAAKDHDAAADCIAGEQQVTSGAVMHVICHE